MGSPTWHVPVPDIHFWRLLWLNCPGHVKSRGKWLDRLVGNITHHKWLAFWKIWSTVELKTLSTAPHHWSPCWQRHRKRKLSTIFFERMRRPSPDQPWLHFKGNTRETSERCGQHMGFPDHVHTILNWTDICSVKIIQQMWECFTLTYHQCQYCCALP